MDDRNAMANKSMQELVQMEQEAARAEGEAQPSDAGDAVKFSSPPVHADAKVVVSDDRLEANICVFSPQFGGNDVDEDDIYEALKSEHIKYGIDSELIKEIVANRLYDKVYTIASGIPAKDGDDGYVTSHYEQAKKLVPRTLEDGSVDYRDLGLVVNVKEHDVICTIKHETQGSTGMNVFGQEIPARPGKPPKIPQGINTVLSADGTLLFANANGNLVYKNGIFNVETTIVIPEDVGVTTGNISFLGDVLVKGNVLEGFSVTAGKTITVNGMVTGAVLTAGGDIIVKNGVFASTVQSDTGNIKIGFGENDTITTKGDLESSSLIGCNIKIEGNLECTKNPGVVIGGECNVMGNFTAAQLGHKNYIHTTISIGSISSLVMEMDALEKQSAEIDALIEKLNASIEFLQEKKRNGVKLDEDKEAYIASAIRTKVQRGIDKKPIRARIEEIQKIINSKEALSVKITRHIYPNVRINLNSFSTTTSAEYGKCSIVCGANDIEFK